jgi:hypothetical protein
MKGESALRVLLFRTLECFADPVRPVEVTDATRRVFQIGLELKHRVSETLIPDTLCFEKAAEKDIAVPPQKTRQNFPLEFRRARLSSCEMSVIEKGGIGLDV